MSIFFIATFFVFVVEEIIISELFDIIDKFCNEELTIFINESMWTKYSLFCLTTFEDS